MPVGRQPLHGQVAAEMRKAIARGKWKPGAKIPTEPELTERYGVSRATVRQAVAALRAEGLLDVRQGSGTYVREPQATVDAVFISRTVHLASDGTFTCPSGWEAKEKATAYAVRLEPCPAALLRLDEGEAALLVDRLIIHQPTGNLARHSMLLPMERITTTSLAAEPDVCATEAYRQLAAAHGPLMWDDGVTARMPNPDESATLRVPAGSPLLITERLTQSQSGERLMLETLTTGATGIHMVYTHHPQPAD
ncbi:GntR family transcriptional regulator [Kitasatospora viridis]|uniref:GntR family transcriptional regulator n=1 Tax=Kitasatospora viridis TaxID=281105 RepID=A0A561TTD5_9ACTN|nr:GntR family transcriptional regulator [Kitasatospora viridis]TWF90378.1 GntR family transcriptional regulator [Kitasatospora viridis]